jgi:hypothetical protein
MLDFLRNPPLAFCEVSTWSTSLPLSQSIPKKTNVFSNLDCLVDAAVSRDSAPSNLESPVLSIPPPASTAQKIEMIPSPRKRQRLSSRLLTPRACVHKELIASDGNFDSIQMESLFSKLTIDTTSSSSSECRKFSASPPEVVLPKHLDVYIDSDLARLEFIHSEHRLPLIKWASVKFDMELHLRQIFDRPIGVLMLDVTNNNQSFNLKESCLDLLMSNSGCGAVLVHGKHLCYIATLSVWRIVAKF